MDVKDLRKLWAEVKELVGEVELNRRFLEWLLLQKQSYYTGSYKTDDEFCVAVLADLNKRIGSNFTLLEVYKEEILFWKQRGKTLQDFKRVHAKKVAQWSSKPKLKGLLRPSTLYSKAKFDEYLQEANVEIEKEKKRDLTVCKDKEIVSNPERANKRVRLLIKLAKETDRDEIRKIRKQLSEIDKNLA